jgi:quinol monooxygenase YgiN
LMTKDLRAIRGHANIVVIEMIPNYVTVIAEMTAHEGKEEELKRHLLVLVEQTRREEGCVQYDLHVAEDPRKFLFVENWTTAEALDRHANSAHMQVFKEASASLREPPIVRIFTRII